MNRRVWISYDLGVIGDYEGMYQWLDRHGAKECGDSIACFSYDPPTGDILRDIKEEISRSVRINEKKDRVYLLRPVNGEMKGKFIFGNRRAAPWTGTAGIEQDEDDE